MAFLSQNVTQGNVDLLDIFAGAGVKYIEERALAPFVGNGTLLSGAVKTGAGLVGYKFLPGGLLKNAWSIGFLMDGAEDIITGGLAMVSGAGIGGSRAEAW